MSWIVIASRAGAKIFHLKKGKHIKHIKNIDHPLGRAKNRIFQTDQPGVSRAKFKNAAPYSLTGEKVPSDDYADQCAQHLSKQLYKYWQAQQFTQITIMSEPKYLGLIRKHMNKNLKQLTQWQTKSLSHANNNEILKALQPSA